MCKGLQLAFAGIALCLSNVVFAQTSEKANFQIVDTTQSTQHQISDQEESGYLFKKKPDFLKNTNLNFLLRSSLDVPDGDRQGGLRLNEARIEFTGSVVPDLDFRVRWRMNQSHNPRSLDNSPGSLDIAAVNYRFGKDKKWSINVGKQAAYVGSWEFETNPTFEYQYSEFVNYQTNIFMMGMNFGYKVNENHAFHLQFHNTYNENFNTIHNNSGYAINGREGARLPMGAYAVWLGKLFDQKYHTFWSYNISQFASGETNHAVALGNKWELNKFRGYLDLTYSSLAVDYANVASPTVNNYLQHSNPVLPRVFARDVNYKTAVLRLDYEFVPGWFATAKGFYESASQTNNSNIGNNYRTNIGYLVGLEYQPISSQQMKLFGYYYNNRVNYNDVVAVANRTPHLNLFSVGVLYFVNAF